MSKRVKRRPTHCRINILEAAHQTARGAAVQECGRQLAKHLDDSHPHRHHAEFVTVRVLEPHEQRREMMG